MKHYNWSRNYGDKAFELPNRCEVCGGAENLHFDHDHSCCTTTRTSSKTCGACLRGRLCASCNTALGLMRDDPKLLRALAGYMERFVNTTNTKG